MALNLIIMVSRSHLAYCNPGEIISGSSDDHTYQMGVRYVFTVELRDTGSNGFVLPASEIIPSGEEIVAAMVALWKYAAQH